MATTFPIANLTAACFKDGNLWVGFVEEIGGINSQGHTLAELKKNLVEATKLVVETNREISRKNIGGRKIIKKSLSFASL
ncbi:type II toxin-antitoxin system HicB family antitoxin [Patescibacteria group bacterium]|nr:type II toxin-antitoxin system HicB family antitoxin [Patescibacteria group bacterium]